jgi:MazG family protein
MSTHSSDLPGMRRLLEVIARLRAPDGCPWDRAQTEASMAPHLLEEAYEAVDAIQSGDADAVREELGDVLMNVLLIARIGEERGAGSADAVAAAIADKLVRRHPHVFGDQKADGVEQAYRNWERVKQQEQRGRAEPKGVLDGVPAALPALLAALRIGEKAARVGFDWPDPQGPRQKVDEELAELDRAAAAGDAAAVGRELGDALFSLCNLARHLGVNPEMALRGTVDEFRRRFAAVERELGPDLKGRTLEEMEAAWQRSKRA